jgi:hypothetical protein
LRVFGAANRGKSEMAKRKRTLRHSVGRAVALLWAPFALAGCAANSYAGISLVAEAADPTLQALARRAQAGDQHAQLELGIRYEEGRGVPANRQRAAALYRSSMGGTPVPQFVYVAGSGGAPGSWTVLYGGATTQRLGDAYLRLLALDPAEGRHRISARLTPRGLAEPNICERLMPSLSIIHAAPPAACMAYPFVVEPRGGNPFTAYDLAINIPEDLAAERGHPSLVDPVEINLIEADPMVAGMLTYRLIPAGDGMISVIVNFQPSTRH